MISTHEIIDYIYSDRLNMISTLCEDWDSYGAFRINPLICVASLFIIDNIRKYFNSPVTIVPTVRGGMQLEWYDEKYEYEIEMFQNGKMSIYIEEIETRDGLEVFHSWK